MVFIADDLAAWPTGLLADVLSGARPAASPESTNGSLATPAGVHVTTNESFAGEPVEADVTGMQSALDSSPIA